MKKVLLLFCSFAFFQSFAQNSYIVDVKGNKISVKDEGFDIILTDKRVSYVPEGKTWEKYIKFDDLDYALMGSSLLKSFKLNNSKKAEVYFVYGETKDRKLVGKSVTFTSTSKTGFTRSTTNYGMCVIDNDNNIIDILSFSDSYNDSQIELRAKLAPMIKKHFSDCLQLMTKLQQFDYADEKNTAILGFFISTEYIKC